MDTCATGNEGSPLKVKREQLEFVGIVSNGKVDEQLTFDNKMLTNDERKITEVTKKLTHHNRRREDQFDSTENTKTTHIKTQKNKTK